MPWRAAAGNDGSDGRNNRLLAGNLQRPLPGINPQIKKMSMRRGEGRKRVIKKAQKGWEKGRNGLKRAGKAGSESGGRVP